MSPKMFDAVYSIFSMNPIRSRSPSESHRIDRPRGGPLKFGNVILDCPSMNQVALKFLSILLVLCVLFRRRIGSGAIGRACRAPCPACGCYAWHPALLLDVCRRSGPRYGGDHVSNRTQSHSTRHAPPFCAALSRGLPDFSQPRPSVFLSVIFVAHRLTAGPYPSPVQSTEWVAA